MTYPNIPNVQNPVVPPNPEFTTGTGDAPQQQVPQGVITSQPGVSLAPPAAQPQPQYFSAEDIERARREEKDKLYKQIQAAEERFKAVEQQLGTFQAEREAREAELKAKQEAEAKAERERREEEMSAKELIAQREQEWNQRLALIEAERENERILLQKEREYADLRAYIGQRAREEAENIAPELIDLIDGSSREEVEQRIETLRAKTEQIAASLTQAQMAQRAQMRGVSTAGYAATGPLENETAQRQLTAEEIQNMPMSDWAKIRGQLIGGNTQANRGLYG